MAANEEIFVVIILAKHCRNKQHTSASATPVSQDEMCDLEPLQIWKTVNPCVNYFPVRRDVNLSTERYLLPDI